MLPAASFFSAGCSSARSRAGCAGAVFAAQQGSTGVCNAAAIGNDPDRYCYTWQVFNGTGQDANDLHVRLQSMVNVSQVYTGSYNTFGPADSSSGYDSAADVYKLNFSNATVAAAETMLVGLCSDHGTLALGASNPPALYWSADGVPLDPAPLFIGVDWDWRRPHTCTWGWSTRGI